MAKDYDGGISSAPFSALMKGVGELLTALQSLTFAVALEEHQGSLVDQDKIDKRKCAEITRKRKAVERLIGPNPRKGLLKTLARCVKEVNHLRTPVAALTSAYEPVTTEPTGKIGNC